MMDWEKNTDTRTINYSQTSVNIVCIWIYFFFFFVLFPERLVYNNIIIRNWEKKTSHFARSVHRNNIYFFKFFLSPPPPPHQNEQFIIFYNNIIIINKKRSLFNGDSVNRQTTIEINPAPALSVLWRKK